MDPILDCWRDAPQVDTRARDYFTTITKRDVLCQVILVNFWTPFSLVTVALILHILRMLGGQGSNRGKLGRSSSSACICLSARWVRGIICHARRGCTWRKQGDELLSAEYGLCFWTLNLKQESCLLAGHIPVVPGQAGGGSFQKEKNYIAQKEFAYRMCARQPTSAMPKSFLCCERAFCRSMVVMFCALKWSVLMSWCLLRGQVMWWSRHLMRCNGLCCVMSRDAMRCHGD